MTTRAESDERYQLLGRESLQWLEKAQGLRYCSGILKTHLLEIVKTPPASRRIETLGVVSSAMLLLGLAFENLIKGVKVAENPNLVGQDRFNISSWRRNDAGHGIKALAQSVVTLTSDEEELLDRLQESILWAGRFPIPLTSNRYHDSHSPVNKHQLSTADFEIADQLFDKLEKELTRFRSAHTR
jgi:hypothetical protein